MKRLSKLKTLKLFLGVMTLSLLILYSCGDDKNKNEDTTSFVENNTEINNPKTEDANAPKPNLHGVSSFKICESLKYDPEPTEQEVVPTIPESEYPDAAAFKLSNAEIYEYETKIGHHSYDAEGIGYTWYYNIRLNNGVKLYKVEDRQFGSTTKTYTFADGSQAIYRSLSYRIERLFEGKEDVRFFTKEDYQSSEGLRRLLKSSAKLRIPKVFKELPFEQTALFYLTLKKQCPVDVTMDRDQLTFTPGCRFELLDLDLEPISFKSQNLKELNGMAEFFREIHKKKHIRKCRGIQDEAFTFLTADSDYKWLRHIDKKTEELQESIYADLKPNDDFIYTKRRGDKNTVLPSHHSNEYSFSIEGFVKLMARITEYQKTGFITGEHLLELTDERGLDFVVFKLNPIYREWTVREELEKESVKFFTSTLLAEAILKSPLVKHLIKADPALLAMVKSDALSLRNKMTWSEYRQYIKDKYEFYDDTYNYYPFHTMYGLYRSKDKVAAAQKAGDFHFKLGHDAINRGMDVGPTLYYRYKLNSFLTKLSYRYVPANRLKFLIGIIVHELRIQHNFSRKAEDLPEFWWRSDGHETPKMKVPDAE